MYKVELLMAGHHIDDRHSAESRIDRIDTNPGPIAESDYCCEARGHDIMLTYCRQRNTISEAAISSNRSKYGLLAA